MDKADSIYAAATRSGLVCCANTVQSNYNRNKTKETITTTRHNIEGPIMLHESAIDESERVR
jgi:hypothetical protein